MGLMIDDLYTTPLSISAPPNSSLSHFPSSYLSPHLFFLFSPLLYPLSHSPQSFTCIVESTSGLSTDRDLTVTAMVGDYSQNVGRIKITLDVVPLDVVVIVASIAGLFVIGMVVFVIVVFAFCYRTRQKKQHACKNT